MHGGRRRWFTACSAALGLALVAGTGAGAASTGPGTAKQVAQLVAAAPSIIKLPPNVTPSLSTASSDQPETYFPNLKYCVTNNVTAPRCLYGDTHGTKTMVLFGDSHAYMWFSAIDAIAIAEKWKLVALLDFGCPVADVTVWNTVTQAPDTGCPPHRQAMIARIDKLKPSLVIIAEKFATLNAKRQQITDQQWKVALERSLSVLTAPAMKRVIIGDTVQLPNVIGCLSANTSDIQKCSVPENNTKAAGQRAAERAAATAKKVPYLDEIPWLCSKTCTPVIGNYIAYDSPGHLSNTYALFLESVLEAALKPYM